MWGQFEIRSPVTYTSVVHSTWPFTRQCGGSMHQHSTSGRRRSRIRSRHSTCWYDEMWGCKLTSWVVCINDKFRDIRERNVIIRRDIWTTNIPSLGFWDIREYVTLWRLILHNLGCRTNERGEPIASYIWTGWVWRITNWRSRLQENYPSLERNMRNVPLLKDHNTWSNGPGNTKIWPIMPNYLPGHRIRP